MTHGSDPPDDISIGERSVEAIILSCICVASLVGNIALCITVLTDRKLCTPSNMLIVGLSCADMLVAAVNMPMTVVSMGFGEWRFSNTTCSALGFVTMLTLCASVMHLAVISFNRYILICHYPHFKKIYTYRNVFLILLCTWMFCMLISIPPLIGWSQYDYLPHTYVCFCDWKTDVAYTFFMVIVCFFGPFLSMSFCYFKILRYVRASNSRLAKQASNDLKASRQSGSIESTRSTSNMVDRISSFSDISQTTSLSPNRTDSEIAELSSNVQLSDYLSNKLADSSESVANPSAENRSEVSQAQKAIEKRHREKFKKRRKEDIKLAMTFVVVILAFVISWLPFCVMMFWTVFANDSVPRVPDLITLLLGFANSCYNPIIYGIMNKRFHDGYRRLFCFCIPCSSASSDCFRGKDGDNSATSGSTSSTIQMTAPQALREKLSKWRRNK